MQAERWIALEAVARERNVFRAWRCEIGTDLFGVVTIAVTFGRIGTRGRTITRAVHDRAEADEMLRTMLRRRDSAPRRIGVGYVVTGASEDQRTTPFTVPLSIAGQVQGCPLEDGSRKGQV